MGWILEHLRAYRGRRLAYNYVGQSDFDPFRNLDDRYPDLGPSNIVTTWICGIARGFGASLATTSFSWGLLFWFVSNNIVFFGIYPVSFVLFLQPTEQQALGFDRQILMPSCYYTKIAV